MGGIEASPPSAAPIHLANDALESAATQRNCVEIFTAAGA